MSENKQHPHAEILRAIADGQQVQLLMNESIGFWEDICHNKALKEILDGNYLDTEFRIKPKTIRIGEYDVPEPLRVELAIGDEYWTPSLTGGALCHEWLNDKFDIEWLSLGLCHAAPENAKTHAKALTSLTAQK